MLPGLLYLLCNFLCTNVPNRNIVAYESVWSVDVVIGESSKYTRSFTCIHWV